MFVNAIHLPTSPLNLPYCEQCPCSRLKLFFSFASSLLLEGDPSYRDLLMFDLTLEEKGEVEVPVELNTSSEPQESREII